MRNSQANTNTTFSVGWQKAARKKNIYISAGKERRLAEKMKWKQSRRKVNPNRQPPPTQTSMPMPWSQRSLQRQGHRRALDEIRLAWKAVCVGEGPTKQILLSMWINVESEHNKISNTLINEPKWEQERVVNIRTHTHTHSHYKRRFTRITHKTHYSQPVL